MLFRIAPLVLSVSRFLVLRPYAWNLAYTRRLVDAQDPGSSASLAAAFLSRASYLMRSISVSGLEHINKPFARTLAALQLLQALRSFSDLADLRLVGFDAKILPVSRDITHHNEVL